MSDPHELDKQAGIEIPYVPGWLMPRNYEEALIEVTKLRQYYAEKCMALDQALTELNSLRGQLAEVGIQQQLIKNQEHLIATCSRDRLDLAAHCRRLIRRIGKIRGVEDMDPVAALAYEYLERLDLLGSLLREGD